MTIGVITTSYPRFAGDPAGSFVGAHVAALRALGHTVEVIAAGPREESSGYRPDESGSGYRPDAAGGDRLDRTRAAVDGVTRIASSLFYRGGAPDALEASPLQSIAGALAFTGQLTATIARRAPRWDSMIAHWLVPSAIAALPARIPLLAIAHGGDVHTLRRLRLLRPVLHALRLRNARLAFVSDDLRATAAREVPELARWLAGAIVQPMGIDLARFAAIPRAPATPPVIFIASRLVPIKGIDIAIAAMRFVRTPARLVIAGDGPQRSELENAAREVEQLRLSTASSGTTRHPFSTSEYIRMRPDAGQRDVRKPDTSEYIRMPSNGAAEQPRPAANRGVDRNESRSLPAARRGVDRHESSSPADEALSRIEFLGEVTTDERDRWLARASVVVVPSRVLSNGRTEGTPLIALEALAAGVPVIASAVGGLASLAGAHRVRPDDPRALAATIDRVLADPPAPDALRATVKALAWNHVARVLGG